MAEYNTENIPSEEPAVYEGCAWNDAQESEPDAAPETERDRHRKKEKKKDKRQDEKDALLRQIAEQNDRYLRLAAEFDNFRKRTTREKSAMRDDGVTAAVLQFLPVIDNFERAMAASDPEDGVIKGFAMILRQLKTQLTTLGICEIEAVGKPFDPNLHEAVMMAENAELEPGTVAEELLKGYIYKDKPIRHSMVKVTS